MCSDWDEAGRPPRAGPSEEGHWKPLGSRCPVEGAGGGRGFPNLGRLSRSSSLPHSTPETAEFLGEDLQQVCAWAGLGWQGRPAQAVSRGPGQDAIWGAGLSHAPSCWPWGLQEEGRERWFLLWERTGQWGVGDNNLP